MISNLRQAYKLKRTNVRLNVYTRLRSTVVACERLLWSLVWTRRFSPGILASTYINVPFADIHTNEKKIIQNKVVEFVYQSL